MTQRHRGHRGSLVVVALAITAFLVAFSGGIAMAAEQTELDPAAVQQLFEQLQAAPVMQDTCSGCHGNISETDNYASEITFTHANHIMLQCAACHTRFPHRPEGTAIPTMKGCFDCHGLQHGPMGELATGKCEDCHATPRERMRPSFHTWDWRGEPHVKPANKEFNTKCAMCHDAASCNDCHLKENIDWAPDSWAYDSNGGCLSCHGNSLLQKQGYSGGKSYQVTGLEDSVHQDLTCQECHIDYRYDELPAASPLYTINASQACADCHRKNKEERLSAPVDEYQKSIHAKALREGKTDTAVCGSCHGGHFIYSTETDVGKARLHASSYRVCARCKQHGDEYDTYDDYYHGRAYKAGAPDAPACWDCHESHEVLPKGDKNSSVNEANVGETCGREGCHKGSSEKFGAEAAALIHQKAQAQEENPLLRLIATLTGR